MGNVLMMPTTPTTTESARNDVDVNLLSSKNTEEYDVLRDSWVRYLGYTNEVGEAFRRHISRRLLIASYAAASSYVCVDTVHKGYRSINRGESIPSALINAGDALVWQMFASILIPSYVINRITYLTRRLVRLKRKKCICKAPPLVRYSPVAVGLLAIPFVIHPIDRSVTWIMDRTLRLLYRRPENGEKGEDPKGGK